MCIILLIYTCIYLIYICYIYSYIGDWDINHDRAFVLPNALEAFIKTASTYHLHQSELDSAKNCLDSSDCGNCSILSFTDVRMECLMDKCFCPTSFYHLALDIGSSIS